MEYFDGGSNPTAALMTNVKWRSIFMTETVRMPYIFPEVMGLKVSYDALFVHFEPDLAVESFWRAVRMSRNHD